MNLFLDMVHDLTLHFTRNIFSEKKEDHTSSVD